MPSEIFGLVESPRTAAGGMQRNGNNDVRARENTRVAFAHQRRQRFRQRAPAVVFERVNDVAKRTIVDAVGAGAPAGVAHWTPCGMFERLRAAGAGRGEKNREQRVGEVRGARAKSDTR